MATGTAKFMPSSGWPKPGSPYGQKTQPRTKTSGERAFGLVVGERVLLYENVKTKPAGICSWQTPTGSVALGEPNLAASPASQAANAG
jgi:hypothetical protein